MRTARRIIPAQSACARIAFSLLIFLAVTGQATSVDAAECFTPLEWQPRLANSPADVDGNFIDDALDALPGGQFSDIIVDLNDCPQVTDIQRLAAFGSVVYVGKYLSVVVLQGVAVSDLPTLAGDPIVAFLEFPHPLLPALTLSRPTIRADQVTSTYFLDGAGVNIAVIDTGVDDGVHVGLPSNVFVGGIECASPILGCLAGVNPDDENGHGTHVAAIALGRGGGDCVDCIGIAPAAGLVDVRIFAPGFQSTIITGFLAFEAVLDQREAWDIRVVNLSSNNCHNSNGLGSYPQIINRTVFEGIVVTIAAGNTNDCGQPVNANYVPHAASADDGIGVAASDSLVTVSRGDDQISPISMTGPRMSDMDQDTHDELKPDLAAPGVNIQSAQHDSATGYRTLQGTSMAAPHVAGCAALILQADPTMTPQSVKQLLLDTAEDKGATGWDGFWGHGLLDCFVAVDTLSQTLGTDLRFNTWLCKPGDNPPCWKSPDLVPQDPTIEIGEPNAIIAQVTNAGSTVANAFAVDLGVYNFGNGDPDFHVCRVSSSGPLVPGGQQSFICSYTPQSMGPVGDGLHACIKGEIIYAFDQDFSNNRAQHNVNIRRTESPAEFSMQVVNPTDQPLTMELRPREACCDVPTNPVCPCPGWTLSLSPNNFLMSPGQCPQAVTIEIEAITTSARYEGEFDVAVIGVDGAGTEFELTGVTAIGRLGCKLGTLNWQDKQTFTWTASPFTQCPQVFDTVRGPLSFGGDFSSAVCLENDEADQMVTDTTPVTGLGFYYLVRVGGSTPGTWNDGTQAVNRQTGLTACP